MKSALYVSLSCNARMGAFWGRQPPCNYDLLLLFIERILEKLINMWKTIILVP